MTLSLMRRISVPALSLSLVCLLPTLALAEDKKGEVTTEVVITEQARAQFRAGVALMQDPDGARYAEAYLAFKAAYADSPSWKILGNLGLTAMKLERDGEAIEALTTYLAEGGENIDPDERKQVESDLNTLKVSVTWVTISANVPGATVIDERIPLAGASKQNRYEDLKETLRLGVHAGRHKISVEMEGYRTATWSFEASGGEQSHEFLLEKIDESKTAPATTEQPRETYRPVPLGTWIGVGTAGALGVGAVITGVLALGKTKDYDEINDGTDPTGAEDLRKSGKTLNVTTDVLIGAAILSAGVGAYFYFTRPEVDVARDTAVRVLPAVTPSSGGFVLSGRF